MKLHVLLLALLTTPDVYAQRIHVDLAAGYAPSNHVLSNAVHQYGSTYFEEATRTDGLVLSAAVHYRASPITFVGVRAIHRRGGISRITARCESCAYTTSTIPASDTTFLATLRAEIPWRVTPFAEVGLGGNLFVRESHERYVTTASYWSPSILVSGGASMKVEPSMAVFAEVTALHHDYTETALPCLFGRCGGTSYWQPSFLGGLRVTL